MITVIRRRVIVPAELEPVLDAEYRAARWAHNRLLDFEFAHQRMLDDFAPRLTRVGRLIARLKRRQRWRAKTRGWKPPLHKELLARLMKLRDTLRAERNASPQWKALLKWPNVHVGTVNCRRQAGETDEEFATRAAKKGRTRRGQHFVDIYAQRHCYHGTFNGLAASVAQAVTMVIKERSNGNSSQLRRPSWRGPGRLHAQPVGCKVTRLDSKRLRIKFRLHNGWAELTTSAKGNLPELGDSADLRTADLCRTRVGRAWHYTISLTYRVDACRHAGGGVVGIDTGHRKRDGNELRACVWYGSDGRRGEVLLPAECMRCIETADAIYSKIDTAFNALKTGHRSRHAYARALERRGVMTEAESGWYQWAQQREMRALALKKRARSLRDRVYLDTARTLSKRYCYMAIDTVGKDVQQLQIDESMPGTIRQARDLVAAYHLQTVFERYGIQRLKVDAHNSTRECTECGELHNVGAELYVTCPNTGAKTDQDYSAAYTMLARGLTARERGCNAAE